MINLAHLDGNTRVRITYQIGTAGKTETFDGYAYPYSRDRLTLRKYRGRNWHAGPSIDSILFLEVVTGK